MIVPQTIILCGAVIEDYQWLANQIPHNAVIICADSGLRHAHAINRVPNIIIGDFDSVDPVLLDQYRDQCDIINDNDQNSTDLMKALARAFSDSSIQIYGAIGERADHDFSNYLILKSLQNPDRITLCSPNETRRIITKPCSIHGQIGDYVGIFPLSDVNDLTTEGLKYPPDVLGGPYTFGWNGACNEMIADTALISFSRGTILLTHSNKIRR